MCYNISGSRLLQHRRQCTTKYETASNVNSIKDDKPCCIHPRNVYLLGTYCVPGTFKDVTGDIILNRLDVTPDLSACT